MRPIKFIAWDTKYKNMIHGGTIRKGSLGEDGLVIGFDGTLVCLGSDICGNAYTSDVPEGRFVLLQFTGLHDRNGREIYEGDILFTPGWQRLEVRIDDLIHGDAKFHHIDVAECAVVGNVYE